ncbi:uncharacterized protein K452DRAFT_306093 [Aplosporella prunicola CBS 121167]|uniref:SNF2 N-terminal domain-containing protein n=1 Tax=Aplosporella prunicola CBS 121167 TaxID=1176127 RepID=A0A6A6BP03_9PEZI|nr:uncharacterized protein K452DRAFT_306093 [Aplosporella prunicola CBS 121167]KAF2145173.1 hypothetical protein K452DRAFT_306093 [Aplosporella prunicola CBS 121167]
MTSPELRQHQASSWNLDRPCACRTSPEDMNMAYDELVREVDDIPGDNDGASGSLLDGPGSLTIGGKPSRSTTIAAQITPAELLSYHTLSNQKAAIEKTLVLFNGFTRGGILGDEMGLGKTLAMGILI